MPLKRHPSFVPLSHDHHHALVRVFEIRQAIKQEGSLDEQARLNQAFLAEELTPHFAAEERHLVPLLRELEVIDVAAIDQLIDDHRELARLITGTDADTMGQFADLLERHVRREEREIFPACQERIPEERMVEIGAAIAGLRPLGSGS